MRETPRKSHSVESSAHLGDRRDGSTGGSLNEGAKHCTNMCTRSDADAAEVSKQHEVRLTEASEGDHHLTDSN